MAEGRDGERPRQTGPHQTGKGRRRAEERRRRLAAALRDNLSKRKRQARARTGDKADGSGTDGAGKCKP